MWLTKIFICGSEESPQAVVPLLLAETWVRPHLGVGVQFQLGKEGSRGRMLGHISVQTTLATLCLWVALKVVLNCLFPSPDLHRGATSACLSVLRVRLAE